MAIDHQRRAILLLAATAVLWSLGGVLIKWVSLHPLAVAGFRSAIALPVLLIFFRTRTVDFSLPQLLGGVSYASTVILFVYATKLTTAGNAILLQYTAPVYVALFSGWLLDERIRWFDWASIAAVLCGMSLFFLDELGAGQLYGNLLAMVSGFTFAGLVLFLRIQKAAAPAGSVILGNLMTALVCLPWMADAAPGASDWIGLLSLGVFQLGLSYVCYAIAIKKVTAIEGILIPVFEPVLNPVWAYLFVGERIGPWALFGGVLVIASILLRGIIKAGQEASPW